MINITFIFITLTLIANSQNLPEVKIYIESLCPDSARMMTKISDQTINALDQIAQVEFIPSGKITKAALNNSYFTNCQHYEKECYGNMILACGLQLQQDQVQRAKYVKCFYKQNSSQNFEKTFENCLDNNLQQLQVIACANGPQGIELLYKNRLKTPTLDYVPSISINGKIEKLQEDFGKLVCSKNKEANGCKDLKWT